MAEHSITSNPDVPASKRDVPATDQQHSSTRRTPDQQEISFGTMVMMVMMVMLVVMIQIDNESSVLEAWTFLEPFLTLPRRSKAREPDTQNTRELHSWRARMPETQRPRAYIYIYTREPETTAAPLLLNNRNYQPSPLNNPK